MAAVSVSADGHFDIPDSPFADSPGLIVGHSWDEWHGVDKTTVKTVTFPATCTNIGWRAFRKCSSLVTLTIPDSVISIGPYAFSRCSSLTTVTISDSVIFIPSNAFDGCNSLTIPDSVKSRILTISADGHFDVPEGTITIEQNSDDWFGSDSWDEWGLDKTTVKTVTFPATVTSIDRKAFYECSLLASLEIPSSVTSIGLGAFGDCSSLATVAIPDSVTSIACEAFGDCSSLATVAIPGSVTSIGEGAFIGCSSLASMTIPSSVTSIGHGAFRQCDSLATLLVQPAAADAIPAEVASFWDKVFEVPEAGDDFYCEYAAHFGEDQVAPLATVTRVWAPDAVIKLLTGPFNDCSTFSEVPRAMRAAPDATTWAAVQLWLWYSPPTGAGYTNRDGACKDDRIVCSARHATLFNTMVAGSLAATAGRLQVLPEGVWLMVFGWLKHDEAPTFPGAAEAAARYGFTYDEDEDEDEDEEDADDDDNNSSEDEDPLVGIDLSKWKVAQLKAELADRGLAVSGRKAELVARLAEDAGQ